jgi:hypothetical protein
MKRLVGLLLLALSGCAVGPSATSAAPHPDEAAILAVVDRVMLAIGNHDYDAQKELFVAEGTTFIQRITPEATGAVRRLANADLMKPGANDDPFIERYWSPAVLVRGDIAMVWAPYELRDNGAVRHCGIDALDMVRIDGVWKVGNLMSTMEPAACAELAPPNVSAMRPRDGWRETPNQ